MPRLTRTQKYADLRDQLTQSGEQSLSTNELSQYEDRLNKFDGYSSVEQPAYQKPEEPVIETPVIEQTVTETVQSEPVLDPIDDLLNNVSNAFDEIIESVNETPVEEIAPEIISEPVIETPVVDSILEGDNAFEDIFANISNSSDQIEAEPIKIAEFEEPFGLFNESPEKNQQAQQELNDLTSFIIDGIRHDENEETAPVFEEIKEEIIEEPVIEEVKIVEPAAEEAAVETVEDIPAIEESIIDNIFAEFTSASLKEETEEAPVIEEPVIEEIQIEEPVAEELAVEEVQALEPQPVEILVEEAPEEEPVFEEIPVEVNDEEFSNTVSMEITKIMEDLAEVEEAQPVEEPAAAEETPAVEEVKLSVPEDEGKDVVEIKNIKELEATIESTMSDTIPFVVENNKSLELDEDEEEGSNVILNIILIVLIVVLIAVLGLIVYYILKTKGIL